MRRYEAGKRSRVRRWIRRPWTVVGYGFHAPRVSTTLAFFGAGLALGLVSLLIGTAWVVDPLGRQVGFLAAPNWSFTCMIIYPALFYVLRSTIDAAETTFRGMDESSMCWLAAEGPRRTIVSTWARHKRLLRRIAFFILAAAIAISLWEWWNYSAKPLLWGVEPAGNEYDWSSIPGGNGAPDYSRAAFSLAAYLYQAVAIAMIDTFCVAAVLIARTVGLHASGRKKPPLLVDIESNDPANRVGFERFVIVIDYMIVFVALSFANFFLTRIQNAYLGDPRYHTAVEQHEYHRSLADFIRQDWLVKTIEEVPELFDVGRIDFSSAAVANGAMTVLFQCFFFFNATLRHAAVQSRNRSDRELVRGEPLARAQETGLEIKDVRERLRSANVWPLGYSDLMPTLSFLTICLATIIFYRIGIYLVFLWIVGWVIARAATGLIRRG